MVGDWGWHWLVMLVLDVIFQEVQSLRQVGACKAYAMGAKMGKQCFWAENSRSSNLISFHFDFISLGSFGFHKLGNDPSEAFQVLHTSFQHTLN